MKKIVKVIWFMLIGGLKIPLYLGTSLVLTLVFMIYVPFKFLYILGSGDDEVSDFEIKLFKPLNFF